MPNYVKYVHRNTYGQATRVELGVNGITLAFGKNGSGEVVSLGRRKEAHVHCGLRIPKSDYAAILKQAYGVLTQKPRGGQLLFGF